MIELLLAIALVTQAGMINASADSENNSLIGTVLDEQGQPISGATIGLSEFRYDGQGELRTTTTDADGKYQFKDFEPPKPFWSVFAYKPGFGFASQQLGINSTLPPCNFTLRTPVPATIRFFEPNGRPANNVEFKLESISSGSSIALSKATLEKIGLQEPQVVEGKIELNFLGIGRITFKTKHPQFGTQASYLRSTGGEYRIHFRPAAEIRGVVDLGKFKASEVELQLSTTQPGKLDERDIRVVGAAFVKLDAEGRFHVDAIETGSLQIQLINESKLPFYLEQIGKTEVTEVNPVELKLELKKSVLVHGKVIGDDGSPVVGAKLNLKGSLETDAKGEFQVYSQPGVIHGGIQSVPAPWLSPGFGSLAYQISQNKDTFALPTIQLKKAAKIQGVVVDPDGTPQPGVSVLASWMARSAGGTYTQAYDSAMTDDQGCFVMSQTDDSVRTTIKAQSKTHASVKTETVMPGFKREVRITVSTEGMSPVQGRVVDETGKPIPNAEISMMSVQTDRGRETGEFRIFFDDDRTVYHLYSDKDGKFETPQSISTQNGVVIVVSAKGYTGAKLDTAYASNKGRFEIGDIKLSRNLAITGTIVDTDGKPVEGAKVWTHGIGGMEDDTETSTQSDASGTFELTGANPEARFAFVEHPEYHFTGFAIPGSRGSAVSIRVAANSMLPLDKPLQFSNRPKKIRDDFLLELLQPIMESDPNSRSAQALYRDALLQLAKNHPELTAADLQKLTSSRSRAMVLFRIGNVDAAIEQLGADKNPRHVFEISKFIQANPETSQFDKLFVEANAYLDQIQDTTTRLSMVAPLIVACRVAGKQRQANQICEKYLNQSQSDGNSDHAQGAFAVAAAASHPDIALQLLQSISDENTSARMMSDAVWQIATIPKVADEFLASCADPGSQAGLVKRMAYRMSTVDLDHALMLARTSKDRYSAQNNVDALGQIALGISKTDPQRSQLIMREAFERMSQIKKTNGSFGPALMMLNQAMFADPTATGEYFWRTLARVNGPDYVNPNYDKLTNRENNLAEVAILLNQYGLYPDIEKQLVEQIFDRWENNREANLDYRDHVPAYVAMTLHDPGRAIRWYQMTWVNESDQDRARPDAPWHLMACLIQVEQPETARIINRKVYHSWNTGDPYYYMFD